MPIEESVASAPSTVQTPQQPFVAEVASVISEKLNDTPSKENLHKPSTEQTHSKNKLTDDIVASLLEKSRQGKTLGSVGVWETISEKSISNINQLATKQRRQDQEIRRLKRTSDWDAQLDAGRVKKIKKPKDPDNDRMANQSKLFQQVSNERYLSRRN